MKKSIVAALLAVFALSAAAQEPAKAEAKKECTEAVCQDGKECKEKKDKKEEKREARPQQGRRMFAAFEGLELTAEQQAALKAAYEQQMKERREQGRQQGADAVARIRQQREQELGVLKGILTPEQYLKYLENSYVQSGMNVRQQGNREFRQGKPGKKKATGKVDVKRPRHAKKGDKPAEKK